VDVPSAAFTVPIAPAEPDGVATGWGVTLLMLAITMTIVVSQLV
jgi:hypothetical protein